MPPDFLSATTAFLLFFVSFRASATDPTYVAMICLNETTFTRNSTYFTNLRTLLSSLSSRGASYSAGFQNATAGQNPDMVTGLFLCRGDLSPEVCRGCVAFAVNDTLNRCTRSKEVTIWYDECMLRYSNQNILSILATKVWEPMPETQNVNSTQVDRFNKVMFSTMKEAAQEATDSSRKFAVKMVNITPSQTLYGLAQSTPDLTREDTYSCLLQAANQLYPGRIGGRILYPSCNSRYELYPFYNESALQTTHLPPASAPPSGKGRNSSVIIIGIVVPVTVSLLLFIAGYRFFAKRARDICGGYCFPPGGARKSYDSASTGDDAGDDDITIVQYLQFDFRTIEAATNNFSESNRLGQGGFGEVYKGTFPNGEVVAVKRLLKTSGQGAKEFKNEVILAVKLKHKNLVRLLGFCLEGEEKILIYEFVPNKSLDYFLFDPAKRGQLDWTRRYKIIEGVARGILYIHQDSQLTVIHRDLKASNILLDEDMNPKISDFGMAKIFGVDQTQANTNQIVGTFGYMSPEYVMHGHVSKRSDVYSFGVLILEIISGEQNSNISRSNNDEDLVTYAWKLWRKGSPLAILDPAMAGNCESNEVIRCIHIGLLCVQQNPVKRPTLSTIVPMLTSNTVTLPVPQQPGFFFRTRQESGPIDRGLRLHESVDLSIPCSIDDSSITYPYPR